MKKFLSAFISVSLLASCMQKTSITDFEKGKSGSSSNSSSTPSYPGGTSETSNPAEALEALPVTSISSVEGIQINIKTTTNQEELLVKNSDGRSAPELFPLRDYLLVQNNKTSAASMKNIDTRTLFNLLSAKYIDLKFKDYASTKLYFKNNDDLNNVVTGVKARVEYNIEKLPQFKYKSYTLALMAVSGDELAILSEQTIQNQEPSPASVVFQGISKEALKKILSGTYRLALAIEDSTVYDKDNSLSKEFALFSKERERNSFYIKSTSESTSLYKKTSYKPTLANNGILLDISANQDDVLNALPLNTSPVGFNAIESQKAGLKIPVKPGDIVEIRFSAFDSKESKTTENISLQENFSGPTSCIYKTEIEEQVICNKAIGPHTPGGGDGPTGGGGENGGGASGPHNPGGNCGSIRKVWKDATANGISNCRSIEALISSGKVRDYRPSYGTEVRGCTYVRDVSYMPAFSLVKYNDPDLLRLSTRIDGSDLYLKDVSVVMAQAPLNNSDIGIFQINIPQEFNQQSIELFVNEESDMAQDSLYVRPGSCSTVKEEPYLTKPMRLAQKFNLSYIVLSKGQ